MKEFTCKIIDPIGLHARPTSLVTAIAAKYKSEAKLSYNGREGNLKSIMNIMALGIKYGAEITIKTSGEDEQEAIDAIRKSLEDHQLI
ncbi:MULTISPECIES: HPr family phosphocarrier protein [Mycoplasmopsis]|uniref:HPr family phosphocarrier protein n=3 Tax=Mycoplasmopsis TaxID=2767358 RepID=A0ACD4PI76_9BACT|nr:MULTISPECIES: HPr family phosphocarrier protein [Mycoplasmopsis]AKF40926.1 phosphocarrier protein HPr [Mycoplasmopsis canis]EIE40116.1 PTS system phosphocarrier protein HPr [Mycoplasmopsis canis UF31]EIE40328.1 PTS system phosphocarrier protein HPr [Mycoplasmopsis canis UF33]EIE41683.1 PTS system phosphocarrier protein HPr [Mycoplasmopsis canis UFG1]EIE41896.1 PTS system phosphocarrier protein HPr [Mycoplasmopsis canis UFG4]